MPAHWHALLLARERLIDTAGPAHGTPTGPLLTAKQEEASLRARNPANTQSRPESIRVPRPCGGQKWTSRSSSRRHKRPPRSGARPRPSRRRSASSNCLPATAAAQIRRAADAIRPAAAGRAVARGHARAHDAVAAMWCGAAAPTHGGDGADVRAACPRALTVDDSDGTPLVVFPKLSDSDRKRGSTYEAARRSTLEDALRDSADAAHACWLAQRSLAPPADGFHEDFDGGPQLGRAPPATSTLAGQDQTGAADRRLITLTTPGRRGLVRGPGRPRRNFREAAGPLRFCIKTAPRLCQKIPGTAATLRAPGQGHRRVTGWRRRRASHGHGVGQDLVLRRTCLVCRIRNRWMRRAVPVPDQSPRPGPARLLKTSHRSVLAARFMLGAGRRHSRRREDRRSRSHLQHLSSRIPDMLHYTLLPGASQRWRRLFDDLRYVVVDESHVYVGGFGADSASFPNFSEVQVASMASS